MLSTRSTFVLVTGKPGTGKSYRGTHYAATEILPFRKGRLITNIPINKQKMGEYLTKGMSPAEKQKALEALDRRLVIIPKKTFQEWMAGVSAPVDYFENLQRELDDAWREKVIAAGLDPLDVEACKAADMPPDLLLKGAYVFLDEAGKCWPQRLTGAKKDQAERMAEWMATGRHEGCRVYLFCQTEKQILARLRDLASIQLAHSNWRDFREPITWAKWDTWAQLLAKLTIPIGRLCGYPNGFYWQRITVEEIVATGYERTEFQKPFTTFLYDWVFELYTSTNNDKEGEDSEEEKPEYLLFGWRDFIGWMFRENAANWGYVLGASILGFLFLWWPGWVWQFAMWAMIELPKEMSLAAQKSMGVAGDKAAATSSQLPAGAPVLQPATGSAGQPLKTVTLDPKAIEDLPPLERQNKILINELETARGRVAELETALGESGIVGTIGQAVLMDSGEIYHAGDLIEGGPLRGRKIVRVEGAVVHLDDKRRYVVRRPSRKRGPQPVAAGGLVPPGAAGPGPAAGGQPGQPIRVAEGERAFGVAAPGVGQAR